MLLHSGTVKHSSAGFPDSQSDHAMLAAARMTDALPREAPEMTRGRFAVFNASAISFASLR